ncbi:MAG: hypothetical protein IT342_04905 [Candidatus Melainabacteria bacterium]|nr:hypothetical protein [Candidatus Melainabacteria bacterium]
MSTASAIRRYINQLPPRQIFSTREVLHFGSRASVDQSLYRMVSEVSLLRLASGLFVKKYPGMKLPSVEEVAAAKAKAFSKEIFVHGQDAAYELGIEDSPSDKAIFYVQGSSTSSFLSHIHGRRVHFKATAARRLYEVNQRVGKVMRALWHLGPDRLDSAVLKKATINLNREEIRALRHSAYRVPWWLARFTNHSVTLCGKVI